MRMKLDVKVCRDFRCNVCGREQEGDTERVEFNSIEELQHFMTTRPEPKNMPVGWSSGLDKNWKSEYRCDKCC